MQDINTNNTSLYSLLIVRHFLQRKHYPFIKMIT